MALLLSTLFLLVCTSLSEAVVPSVVRNVRVYAYHPLAGETDGLSALVLWDPPLNSTVTRYYIFVQQEGAQVPNVYQPPSNDTYHILLQRAPEDFSVTYFVATNTEYTIQIVAENPSGNGTTSPGTIVNVAGPNYPRQVLVLEPTGVGVVGQETDIVTPPTFSNIQPTSPFVVDTITREVFFSSSVEGSYIIFKSSLQEGRPTDEVLKLIDPSMELLDMAYDWIAKELYYAVHTSTNNLEFYKLLVLNAEANIRLFPVLIENLPPSVSLKLTVDPMQGFLYWQQSDSTSVQLHSLNLRQYTATSSTIVSTTTARRRRQSGSLSSLDLSRVLTLDSFTGQLLVATPTGDIYSCNVTSDLCERLIDASILAPDPSTIALPPTHIAVDGGHIYWSNEGLAGVYAVERNNPSVLLTISTKMVSGLFGLSPDSQPLPSQECLSPAFQDQMVRPMLTIAEITSTSISLEWPESFLPQQCEDIVFSFPPIVYTVGLAIPLINPFLFEPVGSTFLREFTVEGLTPSTLYSFSLSAANLYTMRRNANDNLKGLDEDATTAEAICPDLTLADGMISYSPSTTPRLEGTNATHSCDTGYELSGGTVRTCQSDGTWSGGTITCEEITLESGSRAFNSGTSTLLAVVFLTVILFN